MMSFDNLMLAAHAEQPMMIEKVAVMLQLTERLDPEILKETIAELELISEFTEEKVAAVSPILAANAKAFGVALGATMAAGLGTAIATDLYDAARRGLTKSRNLRRIMEANPDLKTLSKEKVRQSFNVLHRYGPDFTADPMVGGALLRATAESDYSAIPGLIKDILAARKNLTDIRHSQFKPMSLTMPDKRGPGADADALEEKKHQNQLKVEKFKHDLREAENRGKTLRGQGPKE